MDHINYFILVDSATPGSILDKSLDAEEREHGDFLRLVMPSIQLLSFLSLSLFYLSQSMFLV